MNKTAINVCVQVLDINFLLLWVNIKEPDCWILRQDVWFCKKPQNCLPKWLYHFGFPAAKNESSCCSTSSPAFGFASVPDFGHSNRCVVVSHYFNLHFPDKYDVEHLFICIFVICISSLVRYLLSSLAHFKNQVVFLLLSFKSSLYILDKSFIRCVFFSDFFFNE